MIESLQYSRTEIDFLRLRSSSELQSILATLPQSEQLAILSLLAEAIDDRPLVRSERDQDAADKRAKRSAAARIEIPDCKNPQRRERCLADPEKFLREYMAARYTMPFGPHHRRMIYAVEERARYGGDKAIAAPRREGKTEIATGMLVYIVAACLVRFPIPVCSTLDFAKQIYNDFQSHWETNDLLLADFPEICVPIRELEGAPQRASKQHIAGVRTRIKWTADYLILAHVDGSPYGGVCMTYFGLDTAIRGVRIRGERPDFALIEDPETADSARNLEQIQKRERMIDRDVMNLSHPEKKIARVLFTTVQNRKCLSYRVTDKTIKGSWDGERFGSVIKWPDRESDLWQDYIAMRHADQAAGDIYGKNASRFYLQNREAMDAGAAMLNELRYSRAVLPDGMQVEYSALQRIHNAIADTSLADVMAEEQNDPEEEEQAETAGLTAGIVASRLSGYLQGEKPALTECFTVGFDIGKFLSHWVKVAWWGRAVGCIVDYGRMETHDLRFDSPKAAIEIALGKVLPIWRSEIMEKDEPVLALVDSGEYSPAIYKFCREAGRPFYSSKGWDAGRFRMGKPSDKRVLFLETYAHWNEEVDPHLWLYNVNTEYWKGWLQERFLVPTFDESNRFNDGAISLYSCPDDRKKHLSFSQHIVAEEKQVLFTPGKGSIVKWWPRNKNNHFLDALALACAAAGSMGIRLTPRAAPPRPVPTSPKPEPQPAESRFATPYGQSFLASQR